MAEKIFYSIPFRAERLIQKGQLEKCDLAVSVRQNLRLLLMSSPMRVRHHALYGCKIHWQQFVAENRLMEEDKRKEDDFKVTLEKNIKQLIEQFEPRVQLEEVTVDIKYVNEVRPKRQLIKIHQKDNVIQIIVNIKGKVKSEYMYDGQSLVLEDTIPLL